jgi:hypothetical protein
MCPITHVDETDCMVDGLLRVAGRIEIPVRRPAVTDDCRTGFDLVTINNK